MPTHEYLCRSCEAVHERFVTIRRSAPKTEFCPLCGELSDRLLGGDAGFLVMHGSFEISVAGEHDVISKKLYDHATETFINPQNYQRGAPKLTMQTKCHPRDAPRQHIRPSDTFRPRG